VYILLQVLQKSICASAPKTDIKTSGSGPQGLTFLKRTSLLSPSMKSTSLFVPIFCSNQQFIYSLHWYLAIICYPKYILSSTALPVASPSVTTRSRKRLSDVSPGDGVAESPPKSAARDSPPTSPIKKDDSIDAFSQTQDDKDVADTLLQFSSCSISATDGSNKSNQDISLLSNKQKSADTSGLLVIPEEKEGAGESSHVPAPPEMEVDALPHKSGRVSPTASETGAVVVADKKKPVSPTALKKALDEAVPVADFYAPVTKGKKKMSPALDLDSPEPEPPAVEVLTKPEPSEGFDSSKCVLFVRVLNFV
jgi:hypothetical protein